MADPVVPNVPGVPPLIRSGPAPELPPALTGDTFEGIGATTLPQWGLYQHGEPVVFAESVISFDFVQDYSLLDYPVEDGGFETYNKVKIPFEVKLRFSTGGSVIDRSGLLGTLDGIAGSLELYDAITPEEQYLSVNVEHYDYRRRNENAGRLEVDVHLRQIRVTATEAFSNTAAPSGADPKNLGALQPVPATTTQAQDIFSLLNNPFNAGPGFADQQPLPSTTPDDVYSAGW